MVLGFSIWLRLDFWVNQYVSADDELQKYTVAVYIFIATGALIIIFGIVGVYGAARPDKWALVAVSTSLLHELLPAQLGQLIARLCSIPRSSTFFHLLLVKR